MPTDMVSRVRLSGKPEAVRQFLAEHPMEAGQVSFSDGRVVVSLFVPRGWIQGLRDRDFVVEELYDASALVRSRISDIGKGNRFEGGRIPRGLGLRRHGG